MSWAGRRRPGRRRSPGDVPDEESPASTWPSSPARSDACPQLTDALDRMWPRLSAEELLHDLFGSPPLLALAAKGVLTAAEQAPAASGPAARRWPTSPGRRPTWP